MIAQPAGHRRPRARQRRARANPLTFYPAWCKRCGLCVAFCPKDVLASGPEGLPVAARPEACVRCRLCELRCPDFAISVADDEEADP
jgi:2-oxoglutarate ferredoxin oxidoreductase subunit delta